MEDGFYKIKTWEEMEATEDVHMDSEGDLSTPCDGCFTREMETSMPPNRIIRVRNDRWIYKTIKPWMIKEKIENTPASGMATTADLKDSDPVSRPSHYMNRVPGIECIQVTEHFNFNRGNAIKYIWRAGKKNPEKEIEDLEKAAWYINREIERMRGLKK